MSFVRDWVEFRIDYNILRALASPRIRLGDGALHRFPDRGSRDALCTLIDSHVVEACERGSDEDADHRIELRTDRGHVLVIPLNPGGRAGVEAAHLMLADEHGRLDGAGMWIW